jgi:hypothetical protein
MIKVSRILLAASAYQEAIREKYRELGMEEVIDKKDKEFARPEKFKEIEEENNLEKWMRMLDEL